MNNDNRVPNPKLYTLASLVIGYVLIGDLTANEQNAIGNWLMTVAQILEANSAVQQALEAKVQGNTININSKQYKNGGSAYMNNPPLEKRANCNSSREDDNYDDLELLKRVIKKMQEELEQLKKP